MTEGDSSLLANRPALLALALFMAGIFLALLLPLPFHFPLMGSIISIFVIVIASLKGNQRIAALFAACLLVFLAWFLTRLSTAPFPPNHIEHFAEIGGRARLEGTVVEEPDIRSDRTYLVVEAESVKIWLMPIPTFGKVRVCVRNGGARYEHADRIWLSGYLYKPSGARNPGGFDYETYLSTKDIFAAMTVNDPANAMVVQGRKSFISSVVSPLRNWFIRKTQEHLTPIAGAILSGFILGERRDIPEEHQNLFKNTGTLHLMAVSGSNVGIVIAVFAAPLTLLGLPRPAKTVILLIVIIFFAILTRLEPSVIRASIMAFVGLLAYGWVRKPDYINLLALAGLIMLMMRPLQLFDVGFQLSFAATFGLIYALPSIFQKLSFLRRRHLKWLHWIVGLSLSTIAAQAAVMPLMAHYFQNVPLSGLIANIPMGMLAGLSTAMGLMFYFSTIFGGWVSHIIAMGLQLILDLVSYLLHFFALLPSSNIKVASPGWQFIIFYWVGLYIVHEILIIRRLSRKGIVVALAVLNIAIWSRFVEPASPDWNLEFLDLGRSRAWIFSGRGRATVACYDPYAAEDDISSIMIPRLLNRYNGELDMLFSSNPGLAKVRNLAREFALDSMAIRGPDGGNTDSMLICFGRCDYITGSNFPAGLKIVWPSSDNNSGGRNPYPALQIDAGNGVMLLASWTGMETIRQYQNDKPLKLLEMPWSAYSYGSCLKAINILKPELLVFSPDHFSVKMPESRRELTYSGDRILSTSFCGGFSVSGIGASMRVETMRAIEGERGTN